MKRFLEAMILGLGVVSFMLPTIANSTVIYDFKGSTCTSCDGTEDQTDNMRGILTFSDAYIAGDAISETTGDGGNLFIGFDLYQVDPLSLTILGGISFTPAEYAIVAGTSDPYYSLTAAGDGSLPSTDGSSDIADIYILNASLILNDFSTGGGLFTIASVSGTNTGGQYGFWTQRGHVDASVPEASSIALLALGLVVVGFTRRKPTS